MLKVDSLTFPMKVGQVVRNGPISKRSRADCFVFEKIFVCNYCVMMYLCK